jgi:hypothetical protein
VGGQKPLKSRSRVRARVNPPRIQKLPTFEKVFQSMSKKAEVAHLAEHKTKLAEKYERWANAVSSKVRRTSYQRLAAKYRRQARDYSVTAASLPG